LGVAFERLAGKVPRAQVEQGEAQAVEVAKAKPRSFVGRTLRWLFPFNHVRYKNEGLRYLVPNILYRAALTFLLGPIGFLYSGYAERKATVQAEAEERRPTVEEPAPAEVKPSLRRRVMNYLFPSLNTKENLRNYGWSYPVFDLTYRSILWYVTGSPLAFVIAPGATRFARFAANRLGRYILPPTRAPIEFIEAAKVVEIPVAIDLGTAESKTQEFYQRLDELGKIEALVRADLERELLIDATENEKILINALGSDDANIVTQAIELLGLIQSKDAVDTLIQLLRSDDLMVAIYAKDSLSVIKDKFSDDMALITRINDEINKFDLRQKQIIRDADGFVSEERKTTINKIIENIDVTNPILASRLGIIYQDILELEQDIRSTSWQDETLRETPPSGLEEIVGVAEKNRVLEGFVGRQKRPNNLFYVDFSLSKEQMEQRAKLLDKLYRVYQKASSTERTQIEAVINNLFNIEVIPDEVQEYFDYIENHEATQFSEGAENKNFIFLDADMNGRVFKISKERHDIDFTSLLKLMRDMHTVAKSLNDELEIEARITSKRTEKQTVKIQTIFDDMIIYKDKDGNYKRLIRQEFAPGVSIKEMDPKIKNNPRFRAAWSAFLQKVEQGRKTDGFVLDISNSDAGGGPSRGKVYNTGNIFFTEVDGKYVFSIIDPDVFDTVRGEHKFDAKEYWRVRGIAGLSRTLKTSVTNMARKYWVEPWQRHYTNSEIRKSPTILSSESIYAEVEIEAPVEEEVIERLEEDAQIKKAVSIEPETAIALSSGGIVAVLLLLGVFSGIMKDLRLAMFPESRTDKLIELLMSDDYEDQKYAQQRLEVLGRTDSRFLAGILENPDFSEAYPYVLNIIQKNIPYLMTSEALQNVRPLVDILNDPVYEDLHLSAVYALTSIGRRAEKEYMEDAINPLRTYWLENKVPSELGELLSRYEEVPVLLEEPITLREEVVEEEAVLKKAVSIEDIKVGDVYNLGWGELTISEVSIPKTKNERGIISYRDPQDRSGFMPFDTFVDYLVSAEIKAKKSENLWLQKEKILENGNILYGETDALRKSSDLDLLNSRYNLISEKINEIEIIVDSAKERGEPEIEE
ncbi:hypothetical protein KY326_03525, partial [Candidatus Woesearchaeota archaeon]|nr:hypothetical protein [Candidatus Woesearchaeota archaeon]